MCESFCQHLDASNAEAKLSRVRLSSSHGVLESYQSTNIDPDND